jgi:hypothetical protein
VTAGWNGGPSVEHAPDTRTGPPGWWLEASRAQQVAWARMDRELAQELSLDRPYVMGSRIGQCPGRGGYGHGLTAVACHGGCCARWDAAREQALAEGRGEPTATDQLTADDPLAGRLAEAQAVLSKVRASGGPAWRTAQLERAVQIRQAVLDQRGAGRDTEPGA